MPSRILYSTNIVKGERSGKWKNRSFLGATLPIRPMFSATGNIRGAAFLGKNRIFAPQNTRYMNWIILIIAGFFESGFAFCLGKMKGITGLPYYLWGIGFIVCLTVSMLLLAKAVQTLPIGTAYPVWTGIGAVGTVVLGILFLNEPATTARLFFTATLIASIIGLKMV